MIDETTLLTIVTTLATLIVTLFIKKAFEGRFLIFKLNIEHKYEERKKIKNTLSKHKIHILYACEALNHRLWNLNTNHGEEWHFIEGDSKKENYYFRSSIYRIAEVFARIELLQKELVLLDTTIATKPDLSFVKYTRAFKVVLSDAKLFEGVEDYDFSIEKDHLFGGTVGKMGRALIKDDGTLVNEDEFTEKFETYHPKLISVCEFFNSISPEEIRYRWDRIQSLHYLTIMFLNAYGYDFQTTDKEKFKQVLQQTRKNNFVGNFIKLLERAKLGNDKQVSEFIKISKTYL